MVLVLNPTEPCVCPSSEPAAQVSAQAAAPVVFVLQPNDPVWLALPAVGKPIHLARWFFREQGSLGGQYPAAEEPTGRLPAAAGVRLALDSSGPPRGQPLPRADGHQGWPERPRLWTTLQVSAAKPQRPERNGPVMSPPPQIPLFPSVSLLSNCITAHTHAHTHTNNKYQTFPFKLCLQKGSKPFFRQFFYPPRLIDFVILLM